MYTKRKISRRARHPVRSAHAPQCVLRVGLCLRGESSAARSVGEALTQCPAEGARPRSVALEIEWLDTPSVHPVMLTDSDLLSSYWSGAPNFDNDHEGVQAFAFVSEAWVLVVASKSSSC